MYQHPIIRDDLARFRREDLLRDGAQSAVAAAQPARRRRVRVVIDSVVESLADRPSVRRAVRRRHA
jgi:hypothetical protein